MEVLKYIKYIFLIIIGITFPISACFFLVFRGLLYLYLKFKHGDEFYQLMDGFDTVWEVHDTSRGQIAILGTFDFDVERNGDVYEAFVKQIHKPELRRSCRKAAMRRRHLLGYNYYIEKDPYDGLVQKMPFYENEEDVRRMLSECSNQPIGPHDDKMLEFLIGTKPICFAQNGRLEYPIIMKMHHSLGDGIALMNFCITGLGRDPAAFLKKTEEDFRKMFKIKKNDQEAAGNDAEHPQDLESHEANEADANAPEAKKGTMQLGKLLRKVMTSKFYHPLFGKPDANILHGKTLTGRKNLVWSRDMGRDYVRTVKNIKSRFDGVSFNNVLFAALAASFSEYFQKHDPNNVPDYILNGIVLLPFIPKFEDMVTIVDGKIVALDLSNKFVVAFLKLPLIARGSVDENVLELVERVKKEIISLSQSLDVALTIFFMKYFAYIMPLPLIKFIMSYFDSTISASNLPGHGRLEMFHGGHINDIYFWIPNIKKIGLGISMFTYDNRLRIGLIADEALIPEVANVQELVDNVFKYLDVMDKRSQTLANNNNECNGPNNNVSFNGLISNEKMKHEKIHIG